VRERIDELGDAEVVLVLFTARRNLRGYRSRLALPYTVVTSEDRSAYRAYGLGRASLRRTYGWRVLRRYAGLLRSGWRLERPTEDTRQLGGDFVVAPDGTLAYAFRSSGPDDRPPVDDLVEAVRRSRG
jgi:peroxiredoxin